MYFGYYNSVVFIEKSEAMSSWMKTQSKCCVVCETNTLSAFVLEIISAHLDHFDECLSGIFVLSWDFSATQQ